MKIKLTKQEINWIERTADIETARLFQNFNHILGLMKDADNKSKVLLSNQINELIDLYSFLKTLRSKLELWDCRYDIDSELSFKEQSLQKEKK
jgi:hypothetical protein